jgi:hypothetical protein
MGFWSSLFKSKKEKEFKSFEQQVQKVWKAKKEKRSQDKRDAFLTPDLLKRRKELTRGGRQALVLQYGTKGDTIQYSLQDLDKMAKALDKAQGQYEEAKRGAPVFDLLKASRMRVDLWGKQKGLSDFRKASAEVGPAVLYKIDGGMLHFRVTASGKTKYSHYDVRIRLEEWEKYMRGSDSYTLAAGKAAAGRVSIDCTCGRHQYWFRYLATVGGFALDPFEHSFPKIRNPRLIGAICKHTVKALLVLQSPVIHVKLAKAMEDQAKKKGWATERFKKTFSRKKDLPGEDDFAELEKAGVLNLEKEYQKAKSRDIDREFSAYAQAKEAFIKKVKEPRIKSMIRKLGEKLKKATTQRDAYKTIASKEKEAREQAQADAMTAKLEASLVRDVLVNKMDKGDAVRKFAKANEISVKDAEAMAEGINL